MTRPNAGRPPVRTSAVATRPRESQLETYRNVAAEMRRPDRWADLVAMIGSVEGAERFLSVAQAYIASGRDLLNATPESLIQAIKDAATLGLEPTGVAGEAAIVVYQGVATLQPMYRGILKRVRNTGRVDFIDAEIVMEGDEFEYGFTERGGWFRHVPRDLPPGPGGEARGRGPFTRFYAYAIMPSGYTHLRVMSDAEVREVRDNHSRAYRYWVANPNSNPPPWVTAYGEMGRKTVLHRLGKIMPQDAYDQRLLELEALAERAEDVATASVRRIDVSAARQKALEAARGAPAPAAPQLGAGPVVGAGAADGGGPTEEEMLADALAATEADEAPAEDEPELAF